MNISLNIITLGKRKVNLLLEVVMLFTRSLHWILLFSSVTDELEETFTLKEIKEKLETASSKSWKPILKEGVEEMEVMEIEEYLQSKSAKEDIRHDFTFYTPTCRDVRVKVMAVRAVF